MSDGDERTAVSRRTVLAATGGAVVPAGTARAGEDHEHDRDEGDDSFLPRRCPEATIRPGTNPCPGATAEGCADDHPETVALRERVETALETRYPDLGAIIERGYKPYFDTFDTDEEAGWSHWLNPEYIGDDEVLNPDRPEAILVDNEWWRPIGVMFVAARDGEALEAPPAVYGGDADRGEGPADGGADADERCSPWHAHVGLPGRFAWWYYRHVYEDAYRDGDLLLPCETPCLLHLWTVPHPDGVYAHGGPPPENRGGPPAEDPGFETDADPDSDALDWDALPEDLVPETTPAEFRARFGP